MPTGAAYLQRCQERGYGAPWEASQNRLLQAAREKTPILDLFEIGKDKNNRPTELIFVERCLNLLKPSGRMGILLPDGNLNNPSLAWLRRWVEGRAKLLAVVSLPEETLAELMVFYCECAAGFSNDIGLQDEGYFDALVRMFAQAQKAIAALSDKRRQEMLARLDEVRSINHNFGYGVGDDMDEMLTESGFPIRPA